MGSGYEYYGNYTKVKNGNNDTKYYQKHKLRMIVVMCFFVPCVMILGINTYLLYETQQDYKALLEDYDYLYRSAKKLGEDINTEIKPRIDFITHFLSYKLPNAVLTAFKKSNQELTNSLGGITYNLDQLIELYRSLLGFDDNWKLMPDTQHMTCSFIPNNEVNNLYERAFAAKERYSINLKHPKEIPIEEEHQKYSSGAIHPVTRNPRPSGLSNENPGNNTQKQRNILRKIMESFGFSSNSTGFYKYLHDITKDYIDTERHFDSYSVSTDDITGSTVRPTYRTTMLQAQTSTSPRISHGHRKRRYAAHYGIAIDRSKPVKDFLKGVRVKIHTITGTVKDMCAATKNILNIRNNTCSSSSELMSLIKCLIN